MRWDTSTQKAVYSSTGASNRAFTVVVFFFVLTIGHCLGSILERTLQFGNNYSETKDSSICMAS